MKVKKKLGDNLKEIKDRIDGPKTFDLVNRDFEIGGKDASLVFLDGMAKGDLLNRIMEHLMEAKRKEINIDTIQKILNNKLAVIEVSTVDNIDDLMNEVLAGPQALLIDGEEKAIIIDGRTWLSRTPEEPELEKSTRGSEDGFVETMLFNVQMIRRRIRDPQLRSEVVQVGERAKSDVAVVYIKDIANPGLVEEVKQRMQEIKTDAIPLADRTIEDFLTRDTLNPFPKVRYTNRPDIVTAHILEGKICVIVDNSPTVLLLPATLFDHTQSLEDYRQSSVPGTYFNLLRLASIIISLVLPPLWLLAAYQPEWLPEAIDFIGVEELGKVPLGLQFVLANFGIDLVTIASIQIPSSLATSLGLIGALMLGEFSVEVGLFNSETILYMAIAGISNFTIPGFEMAVTVKLLRLGLILAVIYFRSAGLIIGLFLILGLLVFSKSFGVPYLWPLIPFDWSALKTYLFRQSILKLNERRPSFHEGKDDTRIKNKGGNE